MHLQIAGRVKVTAVDEDWARCSFSGILHKVSVFIQVYFLTNL